MALPKRTRELILARDPHCYHCGMEEDLVVHHRKNRGMGGSKLLDTPDNLMAVCSRYNGEHAPHCNHQQPKIASHCNALTYNSAGLNYTNVSQNRVIVVKETDRGFEGDIVGLGGASARTMGELMDRLLWMMVESEENGRQL